jgi:hypothetical protein
MELGKRFDVSVDVIAFHLRVHELSNPEDSSTR